MTPRTAIRLDLSLTSIYAVLAATLIYMSYLAAEDAVRRYGHNVDSGALQWFVAITYCIPVALLFALATVSFWRGWRIARYAHWFAVACAVVPFILEVARPLLR